MRPEGRWHSPPSIMTLQPLSPLPSCNKPLPFVLSHLLLTLTHHGHLPRATGRVPFPLGECSPGPGAWLFQWSVDWVSDPASPGG